VEKRSCEVLFEFHMVMSSLSTRCNVYWTNSVYVAYLRHLPCLRGSGCVRGVLVAPTPSMCMFAINVCTYQNTTINHQQVPRYVASQSRLIVYFCQLAIPAATDSHIDYLKYLVSSLYHHRDA
jgi:hypothetical protein